MKGSGEGCREIIVYLGVFWIVEDVLKDIRMRIYLCICLYKNLFDVIFMFVCICFCLINLRLF